MRNLIAVTAAAPLALLAACGESTPVEETQVAPMENEVPDLDMASEALPEVPQNALDEVDFSGTYMREGVQGMERLTLDASDDTYEYAAPDGTVTSGAFTRMEDNRRLAIEDLDGEDAYFSVAEGSIYRLTGVDTRADLISVTAQYRRDESSPVQEPEADQASTALAQEAETDQPVDDAAEQVPEQP